LIKSPSAKCHGRAFLVEPDVFDHLDFREKNGYRRFDQVIHFEGEKDIVYGSDRIHADIPKGVMDKLMRIPYFERAYAEDGYARDEYNTHPALQRTADQFSKATEEMVAFAGKCLQGTTGN